MAVVGRQGPPPRRFIGPKSAHRRRAITSSVDIHIDIWARKKGDFVVAYSDVANGMTKPAALAVHSVENAAAHLEAIFERPVALTQQSDVPMILSDMLRTLAYRQQFAILVGDLLAALDALCLLNPRHLTTMDI
jgi:hypothetical protein